MSLFGDYKSSNFNPLNMLKNEDPSKAANNYLNQIPDMAKHYYDPFINQGNDSAGILKNEYGKLMMPTSFIDELMKHYQTSQGAQYERNELGRGIGATAAAGGFAGTPEHQKAYGEMADNIMSRDMQQYLENALGVYNTGLKGNQDFYNKGFDASSNLSDTLGNTLGSQASLAFTGAQQNNQSRQAFFNAIAKALATGTGAYMGGPAGANAGSQMFS